MKKIYIVSSFILFLTVSFLGITYSYEYNDNEYLTFQLIGDYIVNLELGNQYIDSGVNVIYNGNDISSMVDIDASLVDVNKVGEYKVKYLVNIDDTYEYIYRIVRVREYIKPLIKLNGDSVVYVDLYGKYIESGYQVSDNYDKDIDKRVSITSNLDVTKIGEYNVEYKAVDSSGNVNTVNRTIIVE